ncbi:multidrug effflux MFS transporter [Rhizobium wenxiniae]|uniref:multidrug effflux MFS transporter n=1 Tax=Rhizobium wenxiniae TaxID=1737357 RepID=UPI003C2A1DEF
MTAASEEVSTDRMLTGGVLFLLAGLSALGTLSTNIILPSFPSISADLHVSTKELAPTLSAFFIVFAVGQLVIGPLSDRVGRKWLVLVGLSLFFIGSILCTVATDLSLLIVGRVIQAVGSCTAAVLARATARDLFHGLALARALALTMIAMAIAPGFSPLLGGLLDAATGWRATFALVGACGLVLAAYYWRSLGETLPAGQRTPLTASAIAKSYASMAIDPRFLLPGLTIGLINGGLYTYFSAAPALLIDSAGLSPLQLGVFFALTVFVVFGAGFLAPRLAGRWGQRTTGLVGCLLAVLSGIFLAFGGSTPGLVITTLSWVTFLFGLGLVDPIAMALALDPFKTQAGVASALLGFLPMAIASLGSFTMTALPFMPATSLVVVLFVAGCLASALIFSATSANQRPLAL